MTHVRRPNRRPLSPEIARQISGETCPRTGKIRYPDEVVADHVIRQMRTHDDRGDALERFRCQRPPVGCGDWHVGHGGS